MILGLGIDLVEISRMRHAWQRYGERFAQKILHPDELAVFLNVGKTGLPKAGESNSPAGDGARAVFLASRFAAKEAAVKALGTGFVPGIWFQDLCVRSLPSGQPEMLFLNGAAERLLALGAGHSLLSITHSRETAGAVLVLTP
ncbi:MAG: holo-ACP synthase [Deltaproteobacteria bacterium]|jgi:holo-[acyl-carrier protein] synthase|nr:holo-ACP synthase [Deltaproteobacteria bacterium]